MCDFFDLLYYFHGLFVCLCIMIFICREGHSIMFLLSLSNGGWIANLPMFLNTFLAYVLMFEYPLFSLKMKLWMCLVLYLKPSCKIPFKVMNALYGIYDQDNIGFLVFLSHHFFNPFWLQICNHNKSQSRVSRKIPFQVSHLLTMKLMLHILISTIEESL